MPGEVAGLWAARRKYGSQETPGGISWQRILQPTIDLCRQGITVTASLAEVLERRDRNFSSVIASPLRHQTVYVSVTNLDTEEQPGDQETERLGLR